MIKKILSENKIINDYFNLKIGTMDKKNPSSFYIEGSTYLIPSTIESTKPENLINIDKGFRKSITKTLKNNSRLSPSFIMSIDMASDRLKLNKSTYLNFQVFLKPIEKTPFSNIYANYKDEINSIVDNLKSEILQKNYEINKIKTIYN